jgi:hypothetical protein
VPVGGFFRVGKETTGTVHRFDPNCDDAVADLLKAAKEGTPIATWPDKAVVEHLLERNVPWCTQCG